MKIIFGKFFIIAMVLTLFGLSVEAQTKTKKDTKNVLDYYNLVPENVLANKEAQAKVEIQDNKNGYLKITGMFEGWVEAVLFRKNDGSPILLIGNNGCGPVCSTSVMAFTFSGNKAIDETEKIITKPSEQEEGQLYVKKKKADDEDRNGEQPPLIWELPRVGRVIKVIVDEQIAPSGITLYELHWKDDKFTVVK
jgi:hypothetical protein